MEQLKFNTYLKKKKNEMKQQFSGKTKLQRFEISCEIYEGVYM